MCPNHATLKNVREAEGAGLPLANTNPTPYVVGFCITD